MNRDDWNEVSDYKLEILKQSKLGEAVVTDDGKGLIVKSKDKIGYGHIYVSVQTADGNGGYEEVFRKNLMFNVSQYMLTPQTIVDENGEEFTWEAGESLDLSKVGFAVLEYRDGNLYPVEDDSKFKIGMSKSTSEDGEVWYDCDTDYLTVQEVPGQDLPILTRITEDSVWFAVTLWEQELNGSLYQVSRCMYNFESLYDEGNDDEDYDEWHDDDSEYISNYELWQHYLDAVGSSAMLPNSQMTIETELVDKNDDFSEVEDYKLEIISQSRLGEATLTSDEKNIVIESRDKTGSGCVYVAVLVPIGNGEYREVFRKDI